MSELKTVYVNTADHVEAEIITPAKTSPVDLEFMKNYMKVLGDTDNDLISKLIQSAVEQVELYTSKSIMIKVIKAKFTGTETWRSLPIIPAGAISEVKTVNQDQSETIHDDTQYEVVGGLEDKQVHAPTVMTLSHGRATSQVHITYTAGYSKTSIIPMPILETIWLLVTMSYQHRDLLASECITIESNSALKQKLAPYRKPYL